MLRARLFPLNYHQVTEKQIEAWLTELEAVDCIRTWTHSGVRYGFIPSWATHQNIRSLHHRKTPPPPEDILSRKVTQNVTSTTEANKGDNNCEQAVAVDACIPTLVPVPVPVPDSSADADVSAKADARAVRVTPRRMFEAFNAHRGGLPAVKTLTREREAKCTARIRGHTRDPALFFESWKAAVQKAGALPFCTGAGQQGWVASFDWFVANDTNFEKVLEGKYDERKQQSKAADISRQNTETTKRVVDRYLAENDG